MPTAGFTHIEQATEKWGRYRNWWYERVREGDLTGYTIPGERGTYLKDDEVEAYLTPRPKERNERNKDAG